MWFTFRFAKRALFAALFICAPSWAAAQTCTYRTWDWDTVQRKSVNARRVQKLRSQLTAEERGSTAGCSVCEEDQAEVRLPGVPPFRVCAVLAKRFSDGLRAAKGFPFRTVVGYRVGKTRGPLNTAGERTEFSNHSYGVALDINSETHGLYDQCVRFGAQCRLLRGGPYRPGQENSITPQSALYRAMREAGFRWGGEIVGKQKDFMHFSLSGM